MTKTLSMVSHKNYNLNANEDFVILLNVITCFIDCFTFKMKSQSISYLLNGGEHIYSGFWPLKMNCARYGLYREAGL